MVQGVELLEIEEEEEIVGRAPFFTRERIIWLLSSSLAFLFLLVGFVDFIQDTKLVPSNSPDSFLGFVAVPTGKEGIIPNSLGLTINDWIIFSAIVLVSIPGIMIYESEYRRKRAIDKQMPYFLREIADAQKIGMSLPRAIQEAAKREYGPLTQPLRKFAAKISWGIPFPDAMRQFMKEIETPLSKQASLLILEAERAGGDLEKIFEASEKHTQEILNVEEERINSIKPYLYIVYISFFVFVAVIIVLFQAFFIPFSQKSVNLGIGNNLGKINIPLGPFTILFMYLVAVEGFFSGLVAGKMASGTIKHGLLHAAIMMITGYVAYKAFITSDFFGTKLPI